MLYVSQRKWSSSFIAVASWFRESLLEPSTVLASVWTGCSAALLHGCHPDSSSSVRLSVVSDFLWPLGSYPARLLCPWDSSGKNTGVGCHSLPHGIFLTQGLNRSLLHCRQTLYWLSHQGSLSCRYLSLKLAVPSAGGSEVKVSACSVGDLGSAPGLGRSPGEGNGNPLQYSCLENPMEEGAW